MASCVSLTIVAIAASQNLLVNGDFELSVPSNGSANGWTAGNNDGLGGWRATGGNPDGEFILNWNGGALDPWIYQDVAGLTVGARYWVQVDYKREYFSGGTGVNDFGIEVDGNVWEFDILNDDVWRTALVSFVASQADVQLMFTGERYGDAAPAIDNASLSPVPEPATLAALGLGALGLLSRRRR